MWREEPQEPQSSGGSHREGREGREGQGDLSQQVRLCRESGRQGGNRLLKEETYREGRGAGAKPMWGWVGGGRGIAPGVPDPYGPQSLGSQPHTFFPVVP